MNLAWNELKENILKEDVILDTNDKESLRLAKNFNKGIINKNILDKASYYVKSGYGPKTVEIINKEVTEKFPNKTLNNLIASNLSENDIIAYAYLYKKVEYKTPFSESDVYFKWEKYKWFEATNIFQRESIEILNYENDDKFIIKLNLKDNSDELILAKWYSMNNPEEVIKAINKYDKENLKTLEYNDKYHDFFQVPNIKLKYHRTYDKLVWKPLLNKVLVEKCRKKWLPDNCYKIGAMFENINFSMDNKWAKVENDAIIDLIGKSVEIPTEQYKERYFYLNKDYWIIMKRQDQNIPYFILGIKNWNLMIK